MARLLLVEDEPAIADTVLYALRGDGHDTVHCLTGRDAQARAREASFDLAILDVGLPDIDGFALCRDLRGLRRDPPLPGIFLTAHGAAPADQAAARGGFEHDADGHRVRYLGQVLDLTRYEYGLLAALLARPGAVLSRAQLMDRVWGDAPETSDRTVDTHVKTLRAKLREVAPDRDPIHTHRGLGYSVDTAG